MTATHLIAIAIVAPMTVIAVAFWVAVFAMGGVDPVVEVIGLTAMVLFTMAHLPTMAATILAWRWNIWRGHPALRWTLFLSMIYFSAACIIAFLGNFFAASILGMLQ